MAAVTHSHSFLNSKFPNASDRSDSFCARLNASKNSSICKFNFTLRATTPSTHVAPKTTEILNQAATVVVKPNPKAETADQAMLGTLALGGAGIIADISGSVQKTFDTYHKVYGTENPVALGVLGLTTGFNVVSGTNNVLGGLKEIRAADKISDTAGQVLGGLKVVQGGIGVGGGAVFIPMRALSIAALFTASKVVSTLAGILGGIGTVCFNIVSILAAIGIGIRLDEQRKFRAELDAILKDPQLSEEMRPKKALEHLKQLAAVSPQEKEQIRNEISASRGARFLSPATLSKKVEEKANVLLQKKEAELKRLVGDDCLTQIRQKGAAEAASVIEAVQSKSNEKVVVSSVSMALLIVGLIVTAISLTLTGPVGIIVAAAVGLAVSVGWLIHDGYNLLTEFKSSDPGRHDKLWIFISTAIAVVAVALVFFLSGGIAPIIAASVVGAVWLAINIACYHRLSKLVNKKNA
jgi:hypothetical protein